MERTESTGVCADDGAGTGVVPDHLPTENQGNPIGISLENGEKGSAVVKLNEKMNGPGRRR